MQVMLKAPEGSCGVLSPERGEYTCNSSFFLALILNTLQRRAWVPSTSERCSAQYGLDNMKKKKITDFFVYKAKL